LFLLNVRCPNLFLVLIRAKDDVEGFERRDLLRTTRGAY